MFEQKSNACQMPPAAGISEHGTPAPRTCHLKIEAAGPERGAKRRMSTAEAKEIARQARERAKAEGRKTGW